MKTRTTAGLSLLLCAVMALSSVALAGKGGPTEDPGRDPSQKKCDFVEVSNCKSRIGDAISLIESLSGGGGAFISRNSDKDAKTLVCKLTGADIKLAQDKPLEASDAIYTAILKVYSLEAEGKFIDLAPSVDQDPANVKEHLDAAKSCVDGFLSG